MTDSNTIKTYLLTDWRASTGFYKRATGIVFEYNGCEYLFLRLPAVSHVRLALINDKMRLCDNLTYEGWTIVGIVYQISAKWVLDEMPDIYDQFVKVKSWRNNYCLLKRKSICKPEPKKKEPI